MSMERKCQLSENTGNNIGLNLASVEKHHIQKVLQHTNGYKLEAARLLGIGLTTIYRMKKQNQYILHTNSFISSFWFLIGILFFKGHG